MSAPWLARQPMLSVLMFRAAGVSRSGHSCVDFPGMRGHTTLTPSCCKSSKSLKAFRSASCKAVRSMSCKSPVGRCQAGCCRLLLAVVKAGCDDCHFNAVSGRRDSSTKLSLDSLRPLLQRFLTEGCELQTDFPAHGAVRTIVLWPSLPTLC